MAHRFRTPDVVLLYRNDDAGLAKAGTTLALVPYPTPKP